MKPPTTNTSSAIARSGRTKIQAMAMTRSEMMPARTNEISPVPEADDVPEEGDNTAQDCQRTHDGHEAEGHEEKAKQPDEPRHECIRTLRIFEHQLGAHRARFDQADVISCFGRVRLECLLDLCRHDTVVPRFDELVGDPAISDLRSLWIFSEVERSLVKTSISLEAIREFGKVCIAQRMRHGSAEITHKGSGKLEIAESDAFRRDFGISGDEFPLVGMARWFLEAIGIDRLIRPLLLVGVSRRGFLPTAHFFLGLGAAVFRPLIDFLPTLQSESGDADAEVGIGHWIRCADKTGDVDEFFVVGRVHLVSSHIDDRAQTFLEAIGRGDRTAFIPPEQQDHAGDDDSTKNDALDGSANAG